MKISVLINHTHFDLFIFLKLLGQIKVNEEGFRIFCDFFIRFWMENKESSSFIIRNSILDREL